MGIQEEGGDVDTGDGGAGNGKKRMDLTNVLVVV